MDRTHIKRLLTICLALMLSVSMLPADTFALAGAEEQVLPDSEVEQVIENPGSSNEDTDTVQQDPEEAEPETGENGEETQGSIDDQAPSYKGSESAKQDVSDPDAKTTDKGNSDSDVEANDYDNDNNSRALRAAPSEYSLSTKWSPGGTDSVIDGNKLTITPTGTNNVLTADLRVKFTLNSSDVYEKGSIKLVLPRYLFTSWDNQTSDVNVIMANDMRRGSFNPEQVTLSSIAQIRNETDFDSINDSYNKPFCFYFDGDDDGDYIVIINCKDVSNTQLTADISYQFWSKRVGENKDENNDHVMDYFLNEFDTKLYFDDQLETSSDNVIKVDTDITQCTYNKTQTTLGDGGFYLSWQDSWGGTKPADSNDSFYVAWRVTADRQDGNTQPFNLNLQDVPDQGGEVIGARFYNWPYVIDPTEATLKDIAADGWENNLSAIGLGEKFEYMDLQNQPDPWWNKSSTAYWVILVKYSNDILTLNEEKTEYTATLTNTATVTTTAKSGKVLTSKVDGEGFVKIPTSSGSGDGQVNCTKGVGANNGNVARVIQTFLLEDIPASLHMIDSYEWTVDGIANPEIATWNYTEGTYESDPYTLTLDDGKVYISTNPATSSVNVPSGFNNLVYREELGEGDYEFKSFVLTINEFDADYISLTKEWKRQTNARSNTGGDKYGKVYIYLNHSDDYCGYIRKNEDNTLDFVSADENVVPSTTNLFSNTSRMNYVTLPAGVYHISAKYDNSESSQPAYYTALRMYLTGRVLPSKRVKEHLQDDLNDGYYGSAITNTAKATLQIPDGKKMSDESNNKNNMRAVSYVLIPSTIETTLKKTQAEAVDHPLENAQKSEITVSAINTVKCPTDARTDEYLHDYVLKKGVYYDLLPAGTFVDTNSQHVCVMNGNNVVYQLDSDALDISYEQNYQGSGQMLMKVSYELPDEYDDWITNLQTSTVVLKYTLVNTYENIDDLGTDTLDTAAYVNKDDDISPAADQQLNTYPFNEDKDQYFQKIEEDNKDRIVYVQANEKWRNVGFRVAGLDKTVSTAEIPSYEKTSSTFFDEVYNYRIKYSTADAAATDMVFYDILESGSDKKTQGWKGILDSVDVSAVRNKLNPSTTDDYCDPVVYYSTADFGSYVPTDTEKDLSDTDRWMTAAPSDLSTVTAVAIDCRKTVKGNNFTLGESGILTFNIFMKSPKAPADGVWDNEKPAVNTVNLYGKLDNDDGSDHLSSAADVSIESARVDVEKIWEDDNNRDDIRPESVTIKLLADGEEADSVDLSDDNKWKHSFLNLKKYDYSSGEQREIEYSIEEVKTEVVADEDTAATYKSVVDGDAETGYTITNTHTPVKTEITGTKIWNDGEGENRPDSITIIVTGVADGAEVVKETVKVIFEGEPGDGEVLAKEDKDGNWVFKVTGLNKYEKGVEIVYTIAEKAVEGYESKVEGDAKEGFTITNTELTKVPVEKVWNDGENADNTRPESITVQLLAGGEAVEGKTLTLNEGNEWKDEFTDLPKYDEDKALIVYTVAEVSVDGYSTEESGDAEEGFTITNTELTNVPVEKVWNDGENADNTRPESITVQLLANDEAVEGKTLTLSDDNEWKDAFTDLPKYDEDKALIVYTVSEVSADGYSTETEGDAAEGYVIINTELTEVSVKKVWDDADDQDGIRPEELKVTLSNGTEDLAEETLNEDNEWSATVKDLPKYDSSKETIEYTWTESGLPKGYELESTGTEGTITTLTNVHTPEETEATVRKVWDDADDQDGIRPVSIDITLTDGEKDVTYVTLSKSNNWEATVKDLPKYRNHGEEIEYTWSENDVPEGYELTDTTVEGTVTTITNTHVPEEVIPPSCEVRISKVNEKGKAISGAVFEVYRVKDGSEVKLTRSDYRWLDSNGKFTVGTQPYLLSGLEDGRYEIREVKAPEGYRIKDEWPVTFTVRDGKIDASLNTLTSGAQYEKIGADSHQYTITNSSIPGKVVKTGDETNIGLWLALLIAAAGCFAGAIVYRRRREE